MNLINDLSKIQDEQLLTSFAHVVRQEREAISSVVMHLAEIARRKLYAQDGYSSLFLYVTQKFHFSESAACRRIQAARLSLKFPEIIDLLEKGKLNLVTIGLISPYLTEENKEELLAQIFEKSKNDVEFLISSLFGKEEPVNKDKIRRLPICISSQPQQFSSATDLFSLKNEFSAETAQNYTTAVVVKNEAVVVKKLDVVVPQRTEARVKIEFCAAESVALKIERAKQLLRHKYPQGKLEDIFDELLNLFLEKKDPARKIERCEKKKLTTEARQQKSREGEQEQNSDTKSEAPVTQEEGASLKNNNLRKIKTRYIPANVRLEVWKRDNGCCSYVSRDGRRCQERGGLELDHVFPWSLGGDSSLENLRLLCRPHNNWRNRLSDGQMMIRFARTRSEKKWSCTKNNYRRR